MRCALLALVALLEAQALRTEPLEPHKDADLQQDWRGFSADEQALRGIFKVGAELEDELDTDLENSGEQLRSIEQMDDAQLAQFSSYLLKALLQPSSYEPPMILLKDQLNELDYPLDRDFLKSVAKRSRYYRRYPWKRQNSRAYQSPEYDPYNPCTLTRKDVFKLLVALHDARQGNKSRTVNFCNRKRPASAVYTNIRFLGRRRK